MNSAKVILIGIMRLFIRVKGIITRNIRGNAVGGFGFTGIQNPESLNPESLKAGCLLPLPIFFLISRAS